MTCVVRGSNLTRIKTRDLPCFTGIVHYVYPNKCYKYRVKNNMHTIVVDDEVAIFGAKSMGRLKLHLYPRQDSYFLFKNSLHVRVRKEINKLRATSLTSSEARRMHDSLLDRGMICVFPIIYEKSNRFLFRQLVEEWRKSLQSQITNSIYPSFFFDEDEPASDCDAEQRAQIDSLLSTIKAKIQSEPRERLNDNYKRYRNDPPSYAGQNYKRRRTDNY